ncbi:hypothetical protein LB505_000973 [Fusarium chuoi]|nr:hypothetical protein LB505_000973 [Fusarium chuoi]
MTVTQVEAPAGPPSNGVNPHDKHSAAAALTKRQEERERERERQGFGFFGKKNAVPKSGSAGTMNNLSQPRFSLDLTSESEPTMSADRFLAWSQDV